MIHMILELVLSNKEGEESEGPAATMMVRHLQGEEGFKPDRTEEV